MISLWLMCWGPEMVLEYVMPEFEARLSLRLSVRYHDLQAKTMKTVWKTKRVILIFSRHFVCKQRWSIPVDYMQYTIWCNDLISLRKKYRRHDWCLGNHPVHPVRLLTMLQSPNLVLHKEYTYLVLTHLKHLQFVCLYLMHFQI